LLVFASVFLLILVLAYLSMDFVRLYLIEPIIYILRIENILYEALPQAVWWGIFLLIVGVIAFRSLVRNVLYPAKIKENLRGEHSSRARTWSRWIELSQRGNYSKWLLARHLANLAVRIIAHQDRLSPEKVRKNLVDSESNLPPQVLAYFQVGLGSPSFRHYSDLLALFNSSRTMSPLEIDPEIIVNYLENNF
jgi:hypothetical protein